MNRNGMLIVVSGPSGVGKDTVVDAFLKNDHSGKHTLAISATTRDPRTTDREGVNYYFKTRAQFQAAIDNGELLEYAEYGGNYYGTLKYEVENRRKDGKHVILIIDVQGAMQIKAMYRDAVFVFLLPPSLDSLEHRLQKRQTEDDDALKKRLAIACDEIKNYNVYDYVIVNASIEESSEKLASIIEAAECSPVHSPGMLQGVCKL